MEPTRNLQRELEQLLPNIQGKKLLLHSCCGPCSSYVLEYLSQSLEIYLYYYNPNISPPAEYYRRLEEQKMLLDAMKLSHPIHWVEGEYTPEMFHESVQGLEQEPEGGKRCEICFRLRLEEAANKAKELGCDYYATTLSISPHKNAALLEEISADISQRLGIPHLPSDFKKRGGYQRSLELSKEYNLYRQDYCGCAYSRRG